MNLAQYSGVAHADMSHMCRHGQGKEEEEVAKIKHNNMSV